MPPCTTGRIARLARPSVRPSWLLKLDKKKGAEISKLLSTFPSLGQKWPMCRFSVRKVKARSPDVKNKKVSAKSRLRPLVIYAVHPRQPCAKGSMQPIGRDCRNNSVLSAAGVNAKRELAMPPYYKKSFRRLGSYGD